MDGPKLAGQAYRIKQGDYLILVANACIVSGQTAIAFQSRARIVYDSGREDNITFPPTTFAGVASGGTATKNQIGSPAATENGWLVEWVVQGPPGSMPVGACWIVGHIASEATLGVSYQVVMHGPVQGQESAAMPGLYIPYLSDLWPVWVFQGTVAEDATGGTHVCTLTVNPAAGGVLDLLYGEVILGATATAQTLAVFITDGTNELVKLVAQQSTTVSSLAIGFPTSYSQSSTISSPATAGATFRVSGPMKLVLQVTTAAVSVTQTFSVVCRIRPNAIPTAVLLDTIGASTNTVNTNLVE